ncbi:MAG TPA: hypothetical protein PLO59_02175, partial [Bacteroidia bacterium]|nr:hypothetical protein [Bacteroidia bacterium]
SVTLQSGGQDMGLNMGTAGYYTFSFRDIGYANSEVYIGYTAAAPVNVSFASQTFSGGQAVINITTSATPGTGEGVFVRYRNALNSFDAGTSLVEATGSGTTWAANIPAQTCGSTTYYYIFTSTRTLAQLNSNNDTERSFALLRYDDNTGANYSYTCTAPIVNCSGTNIDCLTPTGTASVSASGGSGSYTYLWSNAATTAAISGLAAGAYTVTVTDANACTATCSYTVTSNTTPPAALVTPASGVLTCTTTNINLTASGGNTYLWDDGSTNAVRNVTAAATYTVTVTDAGNGCTATATAAITSDVTVPAVSASASPATICAGSTTTLTATGTGVSYSWMPGSLSGSTVAATPASSTTYTVTATGSNGCTATATAAVTVNPNPILGTTMKSDAAFVTTGTAGVTATPAGCTFLWAPDGETTNYIQNKAPGTYTVTVTGPGGCVKTRTIIIN